MSDSEHSAYHFALIASNDRNLGRIIATTLRGLPLDVQIVASAELADVVLDNCALIVLDGEIPPQLPGFQGALIVFSPDNTLDSYDRGADLVVHRPIAPNVLAARIRSVLRRYYAF